MSVKICMESPAPRALTSRWLKTRCIAPRASSGRIRREAIAPPRPTMAVSLRPAWLPTVAIDSTVFRISLSVAAEFDPKKAMAEPRFITSSCGTSAICVMRARSVDVSSAVTSEVRSEEHTSELQSRPHLVCRLLLEKKKNKRMQLRSRMKIREGKLQGFKRQAAVCISNVKEKDPGTLQYD